jgi:hypothetical protein
MYCIPPLVQKEEDSDAVDGDWGESLAPGEALLDSFLTVSGAPAHQLSRKLCPDGLRETKTLLSIDGEQLVKAPEIRWNTESDVYEFFSYLPQPQQPWKFTRRIDFAEMSHLVDSIGWLSPVPIQAKIFSQSVWKLELGLDEILPE